MKYNRNLVICILIAISLLPVNYLFGQDSNDLKENETIGPKKGSLLIVGGGRISKELWDKFKELMGGEDKPLVVIPTAISSNALDEKLLINIKNDFIRKGFTNVSILHTRDKKEANSKEFISALDKASGVWFTGGRQWRLADSYLNTKTHDALNKVLDRGGVIGGSSAGATIQGSYLARGDSKTNVIMMGDHEEGLAFVKNIAIDQHVLARNRQNDMFEILDYKPKLLGIGIDESTGIVVRNNKFMVLGKSYVAVYDGTRWSEERDTIYQLPAGSREYYWLKSGDEYNLKTRAVITYKNREFLKLSKTELQKYCGDYQLTGADIKAEFFIKNDGLFSKVGDETTALLPESETRFYLSKSDLYLDFKKDSSGKILAVTIPTQNQTWKKIN
ncbi:cyanophycinase [Winogradskyella sp. R77965]|uniref:cyanophycinase n=1 Tax=Winogradskyella sp. R77965 TaxID=3093872 RepID=UPI0037DDDEF7